MRCGVVIYMGLVRVCQRNGFLPITDWNSTPSWGSVESWTGFGNSLFEISRPWSTAIAGAHEIFMLSYVVVVFFPPNRSDVVKGGVEMKSTKKKIPECISKRIWTLGRQVWLSAHGEYFLCPPQGIYRANREGVWSAEEQLIYKRGKWLTQGRGIWLNKPATAGGDNRWGCSEFPARANFCFGRYCLCDVYWVYLSGGFEIPPKWAILWSPVSPEFCEITWSWWDVVWFQVSLREKKYVEV